MNDIHDATEREMGQEWPKYKCHKEVKALKIESVEHLPNPDTSGKSTGSSYGAIIHFEDKNYSSISVDGFFVTKHKPESGGYYVRYEDGYASFSPAKAFEDGYSLI